MSRRRRVLIVQPQLHPPGGTQAVAAWMIQALQPRYQVGLATWTPVDFNAVNDWCGTSIRGADVRLHAVSVAARAVVDASPVRLALLKSAMLIRFARRVAPSYDVVISAENEADLGRPAIQYVHYPRLLRPRPASDFRWYHRPRMLLGAYYGLCARIDGGSAEAVARNVTLANSAWTAQRMLALAPASHATVVHPPVRTDGSEAPWDEREDAFVCVGRFEADKELGRVFDILAAVRRAIPGVRLHLAGTRGSRSDYRTLWRLARRQAPWVRIHEDLSRIELMQLIRRCRYGIHGKQDEHFGIAPAEMVQAGCIVFLPAGGGQVEIVAGDERLLYRDPDEAALKIVRVMTSRAEQDALRASLAARRDRFSAERFMTSIRDAVDRFPEGHP